MWEKWSQKIYPYIIYPIKRKWDHLSLTRYRLWITQNFNASMDSILNKHAPRCCLPRAWGQIAGEESRYWTQTVWCNTPAASKPTARSHWKTESALGWIVLLWNEPKKNIEEPVWKGRKNKSMIVTWATKSVYVFVSICYIYIYVNIIRCILYIGNKISAYLYTFLKWRWCFF